ncbi:hypothetical protein [Alcanivorax quisquiliarum]|uniref:Uncharacterized protein n=1 Tax=Alcanivorax quisquiliarum TaxID=2933565 RepID=A0ABT0E5R7_9GAMM|nr:hypothetical protein [Alcanivorax quisquiliarum]MCK0537131.1 hypothetical protein [Alcanivorax quisquiliarum]
MRRYPTSGRPDETAPEIGLFLKSYMQLSQEQITAEPFLKLQHWLGRELSFYRATSGDMGTPTEQKSMLATYIKTLDSMIEFLAADNLPQGISSAIRLREYQQGITSDTSRQMRDTLEVKRHIAKSLHAQLQGVTGSRGAKDMRREYAFLYALAKRIREVCDEPTRGDDALACAAHILNDPQAMGAKYEPFNGTLNPPSNPRLLSVEPEQIRRQLKKYGIA